MPKGHDTSLVLSGSARVRQHLEEAIHGRKRLIAARDLKVSLPELTFYVSGSRQPTAQRILDLANYDRDAGLSDDFAGNLDQLLKENAMSPVFFKHTASDGKTLLLHEVGNGGYRILEQDQPQYLTELLADMKFACRHPGSRIAVIGEGAASIYLLLEPVMDDSDIPDGEIAFFSIVDTCHFGRVERSDDLADVSFQLIDPVSMTALPNAPLVRTNDEAGSRRASGGASINLLARVLLQFKTPAQSVASGPGVSRRIAPETHKSMDVLQVGVAPFQDSLLVSIGAEMGFFHEEGLAVELVPVEWYDPQGWLERAKGPALMFSNIFSFVRQYRDMPNLRFLYGANLFRGFALLMKDSSGLPENASLEERIAYLKSLGEVHVGTIAESDWAAQLYTFCQDNGFNLKVSYDHYDIDVYIADGTGPGHPTMIIEDAHKRGGVTSKPSEINTQYRFYIGSLPQNIRLKNDFGWKTIIDRADMPDPYPVNGFVGTEATWQNHRDVVLRFLRVWFRVVNYIQPELDGLHFDPTRDAQTGSRLVQRAFANKGFTPGTATLEIDPLLERNEVIEAWKQEDFPSTPFQLSELLLKQRPGLAPWQADAKRALEYLEAFFRKKEPTLHKSWVELDESIHSGNNLFLLETVHSAYVEKYGSGKVVRQRLKDLPRPELLKYATSLRSK